jgi:hypothetical protein
MGLRPTYYVCRWRAMRARCHGNDGLGGILGIPFSIAYRFYWAFNSRRLHQAGARRSSKSEGGM